MRKWVGQPENEVLGELKRYTLYSTIAAGIYCAMGIGAELALGQNALAVEYFSQDRVMAFMAGTVAYTMLSMIAPNSYAKGDVVCERRSPQLIVAQNNELEAPLDESSEDLETIVLAEPVVSVLEYQNAA